MEDLFGKPGGPELAYRYLLLSELNDGDAEPIAVAALSKALQDLGPTEGAISRLPAASRFDPDYTNVIHGIHVLQTCISMEAPEVAQVGSLPAVTEVVAA